MVGLEHLLSEKCSDVTYREPNKKASLKLRMPYPSGMKSHSVAESISNNNTFESDLLLISKMGEDYGPSV
ncbi:hypothetical protein FHW89_003117 [Mucilaginibacter sp. SG564]|nr:hypothetical protein [Mucilaginibacter sp. SG564]